MFKEIRETIGIFALLVAVAGSFLFVSIFLGMVFTDYRNQDIFLLKFMIVDAAAVILSVCLVAILSDDVWDNKK